MTIDPATLAMPIDMPEIKAVRTITRTFSVELTAAQVEAIVVEHIRRENRHLRDFAIKAELTWVEGRDEHLCRVDGSTTKASE